MNKEYSAESLLNRGTFKCSCGKEHGAHLKKYICRENALEEIPSLIKFFGGKKAYILCDKNTRKTAGEKVEKILQKSEIPFAVKVLEGDNIETDENFIGSAVLGFDYDCDIILGVGSGVVNDICKILSAMAKLPFIIVATAPSMDGYASSTSAVIRDGLKVSLPSRCPDCVVADIDIISKAPYKMICAGLGDMLAKYISICEWRIGNIVTGEYYCEEVASIIRCALKKCVDYYEGIKSGDKNAIASIMEGLVISGIAADYAGVSRPVSGVEHYISHIWDMRHVEFGTPCSLHGIQCAVGTLCALDYYEKIKKIRPDKEHAKRKFAEFDRKKLAVKLSDYLGGGASKMIEALPNRELYNPSLFEERISRISEQYDEILKVIDEELPDKEYIENMLDFLSCPKTPEDIFPDGCDLPLTFECTKDIRDKYVLSALCFDIGKCL